MKIILNNITIELGKKMENIPGATRGYTTRVQVTVTDNRRKDSRSITGVMSSAEANTVAKGLTEMASEAKKGR